MSNIKIIGKRISIRSFSADPLAKDIRDEILRIVNKKRTGLFGTNHQLSLIDIKDKNTETLGKMTSYGFIKGASLFFGGYSDPDDRAVIDYGYCFQEALLELTVLGLGTCWLGGTFGRGFVAKALNLPGGKVIPAISPIGRSLPKPVVTDRLVRLVARSSNRKATGKLFFSFDEQKGLEPLIMENLSTQERTVLGAIRLAPSASNRQPWRIILHDGLFHLYWDFNERYNSMIKSFNIQALDMGIALCHIVMASEELQLGVRFRFDEPNLPKVPWRHVAGWKLDCLRATP